jgi:NAD(P)H-dependent FMN reductase
MLIAWHSQSGASLALAVAAFEGAIEHSDKVQMHSAMDVGAVEIARSSGLLLVCAENSGRLAGGAKDLLDRAFYPLIDRGCTLPYALLISAGNDGRGAVEEARRILRGIPFTEALEPRIIRGVPDSTALADAREFAAGFAAGMDMGIF